MYLFAYTHIKHLRVFANLCLHDMTCLTTLANKPKLQYGKSLLLLDALYSLLIISFSNVLRYDYENIWEWFSFNLQLSSNSRTKEKKHEQKVVNEIYSFNLNQFGPVDNIIWMVMTNLSKQAHIGSGRQCQLKWSNLYIHRIVPNADWRMNWTINSRSVWCLHSFYVYVCVYECFTFPDT